MCTRKEAVLFIHPCKKCQIRENDIEVMRTKWQQEDNSYKEQENDVTSHLN